MELILSALPKTWILDLDGTILKHNGYLNIGDDLLPYVKEFFEQISSEDKIIILTARASKYSAATIEFLRQNNLRFDCILFDMPVGERILINDKKPSGLTMSVAVSLERDIGTDIQIAIDENI